MTMLVDILSWIAIVAGSVLMVASGVGMIRLPDVFARLHGASLADTGGAALLLLGMALQAGFTMVTVKLLMIAALLFFTAPTASHALAHAALLGGLSPEDPSHNQGDSDEHDEEPAEAAER